MNNLMLHKPNFTLWQIWNMCFGFLGIQFGFALQNANIGRIFQTMGADIGSLAFLFLAAPVTGLIMQPLIGHFSDKTWGRWGRRRPYFFWGAVLATASLFLLPHSTMLWMAVVALWVLNSAINVAMEPFRSFVVDMLPKEQRTTGFAMQAFFIGVGSVIASVLPYVFTNWFGVSNTAPEGTIPDSVIYSFYVGGGAFFLAVLVTVLTTKEYSPEQLKVFENNEREAAGETLPEPAAPLDQHKLIREGVRWATIGAITSFCVYYFDHHAEIYVLTVGLTAFGLLQLLTAALNNKNPNNAMCEVMRDVRDMPKQMVQLSIVQFFSWFGLFALWIYTTAAVTSYHYGTSDTTSKLYNDGADWVGILFGAYNGFAALAAFVIPILARKTSRKFAHAFNLCLGGLSFISFYFVKDPHMLLISMIGVGFAWASILSLPYAILGNSLPAGKAGIYMGIFNLFITVPQILAATLLGMLVSDFFGGHAIYALIVGGVSLFISAATTMLVDDKDK